MALVKEYGLHWARNVENLEEVDDLLGRRTGIYVLYHGAMPVYIGKGVLFRRLRSHDRETSNKGEYWDRFSWFVVENGGREKELECLLLEALPFYVRSLNKQIGKLSRKRRKPQQSKELKYVPFPKLAPIRRQISQ